MWLASLQLKKLETEKDNMSLEINFSLVMLPNNRYADKDEIPIRKQETVFMRLLPDINPLLFLGWRLKLKIHKASEVN